MRCGSGIRIAILIAISDTRPIHLTGRPIGRRDRIQNKYALPDPFMSKLCEECILSYVLRFL